MKNHYAPYREVVVQPTDPTLAEQIRVGGTQQARVTDGKAWLRFNPEEIGVAEVIGAVLADYQVSDLSIVDPDLEAAAGDPLEDSVYPDVGDPSVDALHYDLDVAWDPEGRTLTGEEAAAVRDAAVAAATEATGAELRA